MANTSAYLLFLLIIILSFFLDSEQKFFLKFFLRREKTTSWLTPRPTCSYSHHHSIFFCFPIKSLFGFLFEEGDNYVLANTSAYLLFLLIIILLEFFGFLAKVFLEIFLRRETTTSWLTPRPTCSSFSSSFYWSFFGFLRKVFLEIFLGRETTTSWLTPQPTCFSFSPSFYWSFFGFLTKVFLEILLRRETTTSWLTPWPTWSSFSTSFYHFFWFPNKSLSGNIFEEGDNYVLANTSAYLLFLLIIILSFFLVS